jgi:hypothetical protein
MLKMVRTPP